MTMVPRSPELARLDAFVGRWKTTGEVVSSADGSTFTAVDDYHWLPGGHFLFHRFDAAMPDGRVEGIEVIGYDPETSAYRLRSFDNAGNESVMQGRVENSRWTFAAETVRFNGEFEEGGAVLKGSWETRSDRESPWTLWMTVTLSRMR